ncbi:MAG: hypothetical protein ACFFBL_07015 [Promethearchaeota archaeon]
MTDDDENYWTGYCIQFVTTTAGEGTNLALSLRKNKYAVAPTLGETIHSYDTPVPAAGWYHIDVTRTTTGLFSVYLNESLVMQGEDTEFDTSEMFVFYACQWQMLDNIAINNEIPPSLTPQAPIDWVPIGIGASAVVIIAVLIIILKRR